MKTKRALILTTVTTVFGFLGVLLQPARAGTLNDPIIDPDQPYAGKTYSEWAAGFWQYYISLPTTNSPLSYYPTYPTAPLGTGQSGPVWFMCGNYYPGGTYNFSDTIPGGVALCILVTAVERDNAACPNTNYTEEQLRALAKSAEDNAINMTVTIDGVALNFLDTALTSPYRVQSTLFDYTCPAVHNVLHDAFGKSCYENSFATPYTISGAVEDGVFLLLTPLSVGRHTIQGSFSIPPSVPNETWTRNLNVLPVALTASVGSSVGTLLLTWPQTPDTYTVETAASLNSPQWQPANLTAILSNGVYQATTQMGTTNQFFRLRMN